MISHKIKLLTLIAALALVVIAVGCAKTEQSPSATASIPANSSMIVRTSAGEASQFKSELKAESGEIKAGEQTVLVFTVKNATGETVRDLQVVHEKPMHLLVVSSDLAEFAHLHPEPQADGTYRVAYTFPNGGGYKLYADFTPPGAKQVVDRYDVAVSGPERRRAPLAEDSSQTKTVESLAVTMFPDKPLRAGQELMLNFAVADAQSGKPVTDLQKYLGALAHFVIISEDTTDFLHAHPMEANEMKYGESAMKGMDHGGGAGGMRMPAVSAHTTFPRPGLYKVWAQFQRQGKVVTVPFVVRVSEGGAPVAKEEKGVVPADAIKVAVSGDGFEPSRIQVQKGQTVRIAFNRTDSQNCAGEVVFPDLDLRKPLPAGKTTVVEVTPQKTGDLSFTCGMNMLKGTLVVN